MGFEKGIRELFAAEGLGEVHWVDCSAYPCLAMAEAPEGTMDSRAWSDDIKLAIPSMFEDGLGSMWTTDWGRGEASMVAGALAVFHEGYHQRIVTEGRMEAQLADLKANAEAQAIEAGLYVP